jgi:hypothetical protein
MTKDEMMGSTEAGDLVSVGDVDATPILATSRTTGDRGQAQTDLDLDSGTGPGAVEGQGAGARHAISNADQFDPAQIRFHDSGAPTSERS